MAITLRNRQVRKILEDIVGKNGVEVLRACEEPCTDDIIAQQTGFKLSTIRSLLNQLHYAGLIAYDREKNPQTNWYTYTWFTRTDKIAEVLQKNLGQKLEEIQNKLDYESSYVFFECDSQCEKLPFELAAEYDFKCPECGTELHNVDNKARVKAVLQEIKELEELMDKLKPPKKKPPREKPVKKKAPAKKPTAKKKVPTKKKPAKKKPIKKKPAKKKPAKKKAPPKKKAAKKKTTKKKPIKKKPTKKKAKK